MTLAAVKEKTYMNKEQLEIFDEQLVQFVKENERVLGGVVDIERRTAGVISAEESVCFETMCLIIEGLKVATIYVDFGPLEFKKILSGGFDSTIRERIIDEIESFNVETMFANMKHTIDADLYPEKIVQLKKMIKEDKAFFEECSKALQE